MTYLRNFHVRTQSKSVENQLTTKKPRFPWDNFGLLSLFLTLQLIKTTRLYWVLSSYWPLSDAPLKEDTAIHSKLQYFNLNNSQPYPVLQTHSPIWPVPKALFGWELGTAHHEPGSTGYAVAAADFIHVLTNTCLSSWLLIIFYILTEAVTLDRVVGFCLLDHFTYRMLVETLLDLTCLSPTCAIPLNEWYQCLAAFKSQLANPM